MRHGLSVLCFSVLLCVSSLLLGCYSTDSRAKYDSSTDFSRLKTYNWQPDAASAFTIEVNGNHFVDAMNAQLKSKGFSMVEESADFSIKTHEVESHVDDYKSVRGNVNFPKAVISVDFIDPTSGSALWGSAADIYISEDSATQESKDEIYKAVDSLLGEFPPAG